MDPGGAWHDPKWLQVAPGRLSGVAPSSLAHQLKLPLCEQYWLRMVLSGTSLPQDDAQVSMGGLEQIQVFPSGLGGPRWHRPDQSGTRLHHQ